MDAVFALADRVSVWSTVNVSRLAPADESEATNPEVRIAYLGEGDI